MVETMTPDEAERICMEAIDSLGGRPRPSGPRLSPDEHAALLDHLLHGRLYATMARLIAADDGHPLPGPASIAV
jgi:hypothetical protein